MLAFDIETIADSSACAPNANAIARMAAKREQEFGAFAALCPALARVVAVGMMNTATKGEAVCLDCSLFTEDILPGAIAHMEYRGERELLAGVNELLAKGGALLTFNGRGFDLPVLIHRMRVHGLVPCLLLEKAAWQKPWEHQYHIDLLNMFTLGGAGSRYSLEAYAIGYGKANPKVGGDGGKVQALIDHEDARGLVDYVMGDVRTTVALAQAWGLA